MDVFQALTSSNENKVKRDCIAQYFWGLQCGGRL